MNASGKQLKNTRPKYSVAVVANMSAGKSTLINAILGQDILLSRNSSCTFNIHRIILSSKNKSFEGKIPGEQYSPVTTNKMQHWNNVPHDIVNLKGFPFSSYLVEQSDLVIYDTPGLNDANNTNETERPYFGLKKRHIDMLVCVLDYRFPATVEEYSLLQKVKKLLSNRKNTKLVFFVNQIDNYKEQDEPLNFYFRTTQKRLRKLGFKEFALFFGSAYHALLLRQVKQGKLKTLWDRSNLERICKVQNHISQKYNALFKKICIPSIKRNFEAKQRSIATGVS